MYDQTQSLEVEHRIKKNKQNQSSSYIQTEYRWAVFILSCGTCFLKHLVITVWKPITL